MNPTTHENTSHYLEYSYMFLFSLFDIFLTFKTSSGSLRLLLIISSILSFLVSIVIFGLYTWTSEILAHYFEFSLEIFLTTIFCITLLQDLAHPPQVLPIIPAPSERTHLQIQSISSPEPTS